MAIDIGPGAIDRNWAFGSPGYTIIDKENPANDSGTLTTVEIWAKENLANCVVGTFYVVSGNTLKCRDSEAIGSVTAGSKQTFPGLSITVETGDYIGIYYTSGDMETSDSGFTGIWYKEGEYIDPNDQATYDYYGGAAISIYGIDAGAGPETHTPGDTAKASDAPQFKAQLPLSDTAKASESLELKAKLPLSDIAKASDTPQFKPKIPLSDIAKASDSPAFKPKIPFTDTAKASDSVAFKVFHGISDTARAHDSIFPDKLTLTDVAKAHDSVTYSCIVGIETPTADVQIFRNDLSL